MATVTMTTFHTLDGVMQAPGVSRWTAATVSTWALAVPYVDDVFGHYVTEWIAAVDTSLLGRRTYDIVAATSPHNTDGVAAPKLNNLPMYVASHTHRSGVEQTPRSAEIQARQRDSGTRQLPACPNVDVPGVSAPATVRRRPGSRRAELVELKTTTIPRGTQRLPARWPGAVRFAANRRVTGRSRRLARRVVTTLIVWIAAYAIASALFLVAGGILEPTPIALRLPVISGVLVITKVNFPVPFLNNFLGRLFRPSRWVKSGRIGGHERLERRPPMTTSGIILVIAGITLLIAAGLVFWFYMRSRALRQKFGPEFDRLVSEKDSVTEVQRELRDRERRHAELQLKELTTESREWYAEQWRELQSRFVQSPEEAVGQADELVTRLVKERGYPVGEFDEQADLLSVEHSKTIGDYRTAHDIAARHARGEANTEELRQAVVHYRELVADLIGQDPVPTRGRRTRRDA